MVTVSLDEPLKQEWPKNFNPPFQWTDPLLSLTLNLQNLLQILLPDQKLDHLVSEFFLSGTLLEKDWEHMHMIYVGLIYVGQEFYPDWQISDKGAFPRLT